MAGGRPVTGPGVSASVNGSPVQLAAGTTLADVVAKLCPGGRGVAVALDREVVPRSRWDEVAVPEGAHIEIVTAAAGG
jgi:sulfur carrier protein